MSSKFTEAFDSLKSDDNVKRERAERILSSQSAGEAQKIAPTTVARSIAKDHVFNGRRGVAILTALAVVGSAILISVPLLTNFNNGGLLNAISMLEDTFVDMEGVAAFGVWNAPESNSDSAHISAVSYVNKSMTFADKSEIAPLDENDGIISGDWSDEDRQDWESDYDWDPTKANVLIAISEDGEINEVVYERTNGRGQVRQDVLGNAAKVYVSNNFTYVMYVDDTEWEFWKELNFAQEMSNPTSFACYHESIQTVVIHNETGKVFALNDLIPQVNELTGTTNYTLGTLPFKEDLLRISVLYGNVYPLWLSVEYDESSQSIRYEPVLPAESDALQQFGSDYSVRAVRRDKYNQFYLLAGNGKEGEGEELPRLTAGIVNLPSYTRYDNALIFSATNGMMLGTDGRMYVFDNGKLKVFGENFELRPVEAGTEVAFEGIADDYESRLYVSLVHDDIVYKLKDGYLYSMFGEVWKVDDDGTMHELERLEGSFPRFADDGYLIGGEIIAFVDTELSAYGASANGRMVQISFDSADGVPRAVITHIIDASEISVRNRRMVVQQNERPHSMERGSTRYFLLTVQGGTPSVEYFAYGYDGAVLGLTKPITEPLILS